VKFLLDTDICIYIIKRKPEKVFRHFRALIPGDIGISSITLAELEHGVQKSHERVRNQAALEEFLIALDVAEYDTKAARHYGIIRADLERKGKIIGGNDLLIASHALALSVILVTNNLKEFSRIHGLNMENWT
jgi:tRNA(fMet)-specific endonuclease VapC